jgi:hypothetical protein
MHLAAAGPGRRRVAELVQGLDDREHEREQQQVVGLQHAVGQAVRELGPGLGQQHQGGQHHDQPHQCADPAPQGPPQRHETVEERAGVPQRDAHRHRVHPRAAALGLRGFLAAIEQLECVGRHVGGEQVRAVQLAEQLDQLVLCRCVVAEVALCEPPQVVYGAPAVHRREDEPGRRREAVHPARRRVLQQVPELAAIAMAVQLRTREQLRLQRRDAVPEAALQWCARGHDSAQIKASGSTTPGAASRRSCASRSTAGCVRRPRPCRRLPCPGAAVPSGHRSWLRRGTRCDHRPASPPA